MTGRDVDIHRRLHNQTLADDLFELLIAEWESTVDFYNKDSQNQFCRRTLYRNAFSFVEGLLHHLKVNTYRHYFRIIKPVVVFWKEHFDLDFPEGGFFRVVDEDVLLSLLDKKVHIDEEGKWKLKDSWASASTNVRFTFRIIAHVYGIDTARDPFREAGWAASQSEIELFIQRLSTSSK